MTKPLLLSLFTAPLLMLAGCANHAPHEDPGAGGDERVHGSAGIRFQSQDTSRFMPDRAP